MLRLFDVKLMLRALKIRKYGLIKLIIISGKGITTLGGAGGNGVRHGAKPPSYTSFSTAGGVGGIGRIRIDSVVFAGHIPDDVGVVYRTNMSNLFYVRLC